MEHFVLIDCNNFYASCERVFNPRLEGRPIVILSNNDGCVIARSEEAKQLNIKMGIPYFQIKNLCRFQDISVFSSNYPLYDDLSQRVMNILTEMTPDIEVYSIDEAFLSFPSVMDADAITTRCLEIRSILKKWVGLPTSIGIGPSKTLAKIANVIAKKRCVKGVFNLSSPEDQQVYLRQCPIGEVWGVGRNFGEQLRIAGIMTAWDLRQSDPTMIRKMMGVVGERMVWELRGKSCLALEEIAAKKNICSSRSFGVTITTYKDLAEAISTYADKACLKLRNQEGYATSFSVFAETVLEKETGTRKYYSKTQAFPVPTNDTGEVIAAAKKCMKLIFQEGVRYKKCGILLLDIIKKNQFIPDLFCLQDQPKKDQLMKVVDSLNKKFGKNTLFYGAMGINPVWKMRSAMRSNRYTTNWNELAIAHCR